MSAPRYVPGDWYPAPLPENVAIGARSSIWSAFAFRHHHSEQPDAIRIGEDCGLYHGTCFLTGRLGRVEIGSFSSIVAAIFATSGTISVGSHALVAHDVTFADDEVAVPPTPRGRLEGNRIEIGENVWIGARATLLGGARVGEGSVVGAGSVVASDIPAFSIVAGNPGRVVGRTPGAR